MLKQNVLKLPIVDLDSDDVTSAVESIRQACTEFGFFYIVNHGVDKELCENLFAQSKDFFSLPLVEKLRLPRKEEHRGYSAVFVEKIDPVLNPKGDFKESFYIGPFDDEFNQWPKEDDLPNWREIMESYYKRVMHAGRKLLSLLALSLNLDKNFFDKVGAFNKLMVFLRLLHYPGDLMSSSDEVYGASPHSDYGMITLLATDGTLGLQVCREKDHSPRLWENVPHVDGALIVNIGDLLERWTNCQYRSTMHRVILTGKERYSAAVFFHPDDNCVVECIESCCSESSPPRFPPIRSGDSPTAVQERICLTNLTTESILRKQFDKSKVILCSLILCSEVGVSISGFGSD